MGEGGRLLLPAAGGEALDKLSILDIKLRRIRDARKLANVRRERDALLERLPPGFQDGAMADIYLRLVEINEQLWDVEDGVRACEARRDFGARFVELARSVYRLNDKRAGLKRAASEASGSEIVEEKSYAAY